MNRQSQLFKNIDSKRIIGSILSSDTSDIVLKAITRRFNPPPPALQTTGEKYLIINGDDLCANDETDKAILAAYNNGVLTSTSAFVNFPGSVEKLKSIHQAYPELPIGLHLNLTNGMPVSGTDAVKGLVDGKGEFYNIDALLPYLYGIPVEQVKKELNAQLELFLSSGLVPDHIDYHFHLVASYTPYFAIVREIALKYSIPLRNPFPFSLYKIIRLNQTGGGSQTGIKKLIKFGLTHPFKSIPLLRSIGPAALNEQIRLMQNEGIKSPDWLIDNFLNNATPEVFISILNQLPAGVSELVCHPGRNGELEVLTSLPVKKAIEELNIRLLTYNDLKKIQQNKPDLN